MPETCKFAMFLDSGAFGAWKRGIEIPLKDYIRFIKRHEHLLSAYVAMDVIPGLPPTLSKEGAVGGISANTQEDVEISAQKSFDNLRRMQDAGLTPIPVFHQSEDYKWLERMIDDGNTYIGISPYLRSHRSKIMEFLDNSFSIVCDAKGNPRVKTHGFGVTDPVFMSRVPWHSTDSTSWNLSAAYGSVKLPVYVNGKPDYRVTSVTLSVSGKGGGRRYQMGGWAAAQNSLLYEHAMQFLEEAGLTLLQVRNAYHMRLIATIKYYQKVEEACQNVVFKHRVHTRTVEKHWDSAAVASARKRSFRLQYAVLPTNAVTNGALNFCGVTNRLISYLDLKDWSEEAIESYVATGLPHEQRLRSAKRNWSERSSYLIHRRLMIEHRANAAPEYDIVSSGDFSFSPDEGNI